MDAEPQLPAPSGKGRPWLLTDDELRSRLYELFPRLEALWPQFKEAIQEAKDAEHLGDLLLEKCPNRGGDNPFQKHIRYRDQIWGFVTSDRFNHRWEQMACAMAGVPELKPRSSLNRCSKLLPLENLENYD
jgi:hypothetical protein